MQNRLKSLMSAIAESAIKFDSQRIEALMDGIYRVYENVKKERDNLLEFIEEHDMKKENHCRKAVDKILKDLCGRQGGDHFWESINQVTMDEIRDTWTNIILNELQ